MQVTIEPAPSHVWWESGGGGVQKGMMLFSTNTRTHIHTNTARVEAVPLKTQPPHTINPQWIRFRPRHVEFQHADHV